MRAPLSVSLVGLCALSVLVLAKYFPIVIVASVSSLQPLCVKNMMLSSGWVLPPQFIGRKSPCDSPRNIFTRCNSALIILATLLIIYARQQMNDEPSINGLVQLEKELDSAGPSLQRDAKINLLKLLQVSTVTNFEAAYNDLYYELNRDGGLECLRRIQPVPAESGRFLQPKELDLRNFEEDARLAKQLQFYLEEAQAAKRLLDKLVEEALRGCEGCKGEYPEVKNLDSTKRKAIKQCDGDVRRISDMARVAVVCDSPEDLERVYTRLMGRLQVNKVDLWSKVKFCGPSLDVALIWHETALRSCCWGPGRKRFYVYTDR